MTVERECPGVPADWINGWLAAVGATVLDSRIRLRWTTDDIPLAVLVGDGVDPIDAILESWPSAQALREMPIAEGWRRAGSMKRNVPVDLFQERAKLARGGPYAWTLSSTMTDLQIDEKGCVEHGPFDASGPGTVKWLHHRLMRLHERVEPSEERLLDSLSGRADREQTNGLAFDQTRLGSLADKTDPRVDPVIEVCAFFGLAVLPVRGDGGDRRQKGSLLTGTRQRGWYRSEQPSDHFFAWPAWRQPLDHAGIDALLDVWRPRRKAGWALLGIHAGWRSLAYMSRDRADPTKAYGAHRL